jgi:hypothetical protein
VTTSAQKGTDNIVIGICGNEKECLTVMATLRASGKRNPCNVLAREQTACVERTQIGNLGEHREDYSATGWMTQDPFARHLEFVRGLMEDGQKTIHLFVNGYPVHAQDAAQKLAGSLNIQIHFIPAGLTDQYQPLHRRIFGGLKSSIGRMFLRRAAIERGA